MNDPLSQSQPLKFAPFGITKRRQRINVFKVGKLWVFKHFFEDKETFKALLDHYNKDQYRFEFKSISARNDALKILEQNGAHMLYKTTAILIYCNLPLLSNGLCISFDVESVVKKYITRSKK